MRRRRASSRARCGFINDAFSFFLVVAPHAGRSTTRMAGRPWGSNRFEPTAPSTSSKSRSGCASKSAPKMKRNVRGRPMPPPAREKGHPPRHCRVQSMADTASAPRICHVGISICWRTADVARKMSPGSRPAASAFEPSPTAPTTTIGRPSGSSDSCRMTPHGTATSNCKRELPCVRGSKKHSVSSTDQSDRAIGSTADSPFGGGGGGASAVTVGANSDSDSAASLCRRAASAKSDAASSPPGAVCSKAVLQRAYPPVCSSAILRGAILGCSASMPTVRLSASVQRHNAFMM